MPTWPDYIRLSLLVSMASVAGMVALARQRLPRAARWSTGVGVLLLFVFQQFAGRAQRPRNAVCGGAGRLGLAGLLPRAVANGGWPGLCSRLGWG